jgi:hypothetical protein
MKRRDKEAQFAAAWVADGRQILAYLWEDEDQYYVEHKTCDPTLRLSFALNFPTAEAAWIYFEHIRIAKDDVRKHIENSFEKLFEQAGKDYENEIGMDEDDATLP